MELENRVVGVSAVVGGTLAFLGVVAVAGNALVAGERNALVPQGDLVPSLADPAVPGSGLSNDPLAGFSVVLSVDFDRHAPIPASAPRVEPAPVLVEMPTPLPRPNPGPTLADAIETEPVAGTRTGGPSFAAVLGEAEKIDPFGAWLAADMIAPRVAGPSWALLPSTRTGAAPADVDGRPSLGTALAEAVVRGPRPEAAGAQTAAAADSGEAADSLLPDWSSSGFEAVKFDIARLLGRLREGLFGGGEDATDTPSAESTATAEARGQPGPAPETADVAPAEEVLALTGDPTARPSAQDLAERAPRSLGVVNLSRLIATEPAPEFKVKTVTPGTLASVIRTAPRPEAARDDSGPEPDAPAVGSLDAMDPLPERGEGIELASLIRVPPPAKSEGKRAARPAHKAVARVRATPPRPRLRPFDARSHGIRVTPGSSAASLANMLQDVSSRPASNGFGPVLRAADRRMSFDQLLSKAGGKQHLAVSGRAPRKQQGKAPAARLVTGARNLRLVLTTEGAFLD